LRNSTATTSAATSDNIRSSEYRVRLCISVVFTLSRPALQWPVAALDKDAKERTRG
jgi:hypothetical protein